ncbi:hypothetical protein BaRGS_00013660 [Batillaria attramentaria]|uniref:Acyl carrier protein n=1 Tax=Batillaria attramentaria TaxID=370345 RepID=A0ABD0L6R4_9CAEN
MMAAVLRNKKAFCQLAASVYNTTFHGPNTAEVALKTDSFIPRCAHSLTIQPHSFRSGPLLAVQSRHIIVGTMQTVEERVMKTLQRYDKIDKNELNLNSHFGNDLGLDSLDHVELMMLVEEEFACKISDNVSKNLMHPHDIVDFISKLGRPPAGKPTL